MNVLICTAFDIEVPCAGLNRLSKMSEALKSEGVNCFIGVGCKKGLSDAMCFDEVNGVTYVLFSREKYKQRRHSKTLQFCAEATAFYYQNLDYLKSKLFLSGIIIYAPQGQMVSPLTKLAKSLRMFTVADCGEYYDPTIKYLLNGIVYQQALFRYRDFKALNGVIAPGVKWAAQSDKAGVPSVFIPGFIDSVGAYRKKPASVGPVNITYMGRFVSRELPDVIIKAIEILIAKQVPFHFHHIGNAGDSALARRCLKRLKQLNCVNARFVEWGFVSQTKRDEILADSDVFILLRKQCSETEFLFPSRMLEYLSSGNPTILSDVRYINALFSEGQGVCFIPPSNKPEDIASKIEELWRSPPQAFQIGKMGRAFVRQTFRKNLLGKKLADFLKGLDY